MQNQTPKMYVANFVKKLIIILDTQKNSSIISWTIDTKSFQIKNIIKFTQKILPIYFKHSNFASFVKQLNMHNFVKIRHSQGQNVYKNQNFQKSDPQKYMLIKRKKPYTRKYTFKTKLFKYDRINSQNDGNIEEQLRDLQQRTQQLQRACKSLFRQNQLILNQNIKYVKKLSEKMQFNKQMLQKLIWIILLRNHNNNNQQMSRQYVQSILAMQNQKGNKNKKRQHKATLKQMSINGNEIIDFQDFIWNKLNSYAQCYNNNSSKLFITNEAEKEDEIQQKIQRQQFEIFDENSQLQDCID